MFDDEQEDRVEIRGVLARHVELGAAAIAAAPRVWPDPAAGAR